MINGTDQIGIDNRREDYQYGKETVSNVVGELVSEQEDAETFLIGAHYDSVARTVGADDNASGAVATLIAESRLAAAGIDMPLAPGEMSGTEGERLAAEFFKAKMEAYGLSNVRLEPFDYVGWTRGEAKLEIIPVTRTIPSITVSSPSGTT